MQSVDAILTTVWMRLSVVVAVLVVLVIAIILLAQWKRQRTLLAQVFGKAADPAFYERIDAMTKAYQEQTATQQETRAACAALESKSHVFYDTVDIEHYDAFAGQVGKVSFSMLLINHDGDGLILTSLTNTQTSKLYIKKIQKWHSETELSHEEEALLKKNFPA